MGITLDMEITGMADMEEDTAKTTVDMGRTGRTDSMVTRVLLAGISVVITRRKTTTGTVVV